MVSYITQHGSYDILQLAPVWSHEVAKEALDQGHVQMQSDGNFSNRLPIPIET